MPLNWRMLTSIRSTVVDLDQAIKKSSTSSWLHWLGGLYWKEGVISQKSDTKRRIRKSVNEEYKNSSLYIYLIRLFYLIFNSYLGILTIKRRMCSRMLMNFNRQKFCKGTKKKFFFFKLETITSFSSHKQTHCILIPTDYLQNEMFVHEI